MLTADAIIRLCRARDRLREVDLVPLHINQVAREAALSPYHFIRRFHAVFGETPHQYRMRARLETAKHRLAQGRGTVTEVCMDLGFSSLGSFSHLFTQRFGEPPSAYRRRFVSPGTIALDLPAALTPWCTSLMTAAWANEPQFSRSRGKIVVQDYAILQTKALRT